MSRPLNVLQFICPTGFYGAERWILALAKNLKEDEINCCLAVTVEDNSKDLEITRHFMALDRRVFEIPMGGRFDISVVSKLCRLIKKEKMDIIHTHGYKSDILGLIAARFAGIKAVATPHGFENAGDWKLKAYIGLGNQFLKWFDYVVPLSRQLCRDMDHINVKKRKVTYIQNGVDLDEVEEMRLRDEGAIERSQDKKRIGFVGQIISRKNVFDLLDIFESLSQKHDNLELILLGDGEQREALEVYAKALSSSPSIEFLGFRDDRLDWLKTFDIFVMTSTLEGVPRCLMEAMAMGIPVVAYDIAGIDQLITHEYTGLLAPLGEKEKLATHWEKILFDAEFANQLSNAAREFVYEHFSGQRMAREYTELFKGMVTTK